MTSNFELSPIQIIRRAARLFAARGQQLIKFYCIASVPLVIVLFAGMWFTRALDSSVSMRTVEQPTRSLEGRSAQHEAFKVNDPSVLLYLTPTELNIRKAQGTSTYGVWETLSRNPLALGIPFVIILLGFTINYFGQPYFLSYAYRRMYDDAIHHDSSDDEILLRSRYRNFWILLGAQVLSTLIAIVTYVFRTQNPYGGVFPFNVFGLSRFAAIVILVFLIPFVVYVAFRLWFVFLSMVAEELSFTAGLARSWSVTRGRFWRTMGTVGLLGLPGLIFRIVLQMSGISLMLSVLPSNMLQSFHSTFFAGLDAFAWVACALLLVEEIVYGVFSSPLEISLFVTFATQFDSQITENQANYEAVS